MPRCQRGLRKVFAVVVSACMLLAGARPAAARVRVVVATARAGTPVVPAAFPGTIGAISSVRPGIGSLRRGLSLPLLSIPKLRPVLAAAAPSVHSANLPAPAAVLSAQAESASPGKASAPLGALQTVGRRLRSPSGRRAGENKRRVLDLFFTGRPSDRSGVAAAGNSIAGAAVSKNGLARAREGDRRDPSFELPAPGRSSVSRIWAPLLAASLILPASSTFHEIGHYLAARLFRRPAQLRVEKVLVTDKDSLSYPKQIIISAAGPAFNFILAGAATALNLAVAVDPLASAVLWAYAGLNAYFGATNLIPLKPSRQGLLKALGESGETDGWHVREAWRAWKKARRGPRGLSREELLAADRRGEVRPEDYSDFDARLDRLAGPAGDVARIRFLTRAVIDLEERYSLLSAAELGNETARLRKKLRRGSSLDDLLPEAFAAMRETMARVLAKRPYVEQVAAGVGVHMGRVLEQKTGEGKTLSIGLAAYLNALAGPVDIYTFNPYLSLRDADEIGRVMTYLGLTSGVQQGRGEAYLFSDKTGSQRDDYEGNMVRVSRADLYRKADVVYGYSHGFVFDHLFDQDADSAQRHMMKTREKRFAIVDEADAELLEEANTDFRIVSPESRGGMDYRYLYSVTGEWTEGEDFTVHPKTREIRLTQKSKDFLRNLRKVDDQFGGWKHLELYARNALKARHVLRLDKDYVVLKDDVVILDAHTGRLQYGRSWESGLHRFIEIKEGLSPKDDYRHSSHIALDSFMRLYDKVSGITGTVGPASAEFERVYGLKSLLIPEHRPSVRVDHPDRVYRTKQAKFAALVAEAVEVAGEGRPVLIGAKDLAESVLIAGMLEDLGAGFSLLNGAQKETEKEIVAKAGRKGAITVATQLAGRGTDISPGKAELALGGLHVLLSTKNGTLRVDLQYRGRGARQGRPGSSRQYLSLEDELIVRTAAEEELAALKKAVGRRTVKGVDATDPALIAVLEAVQGRASAIEVAGRDDIRAKDALLAPIRADYFALRARQFRLFRLARAQALADLHAGWGDFAAEYEDLRLERGVRLTEEEVRARYDELVLAPYQKGRRPGRLLKTLVKRPFQAAAVFFADSWYAKSSRWLVRVFVRPFRTRWHKTFGKRAAKKSRHKAARKHFKRLTQLKPKDADAYFNLALARFALEDYDGAIENFINVLHLLWDDKIGYSYNHRSMIGTSIENLGASFHNRALARARAGDALGAAVSLRAAYEMEPITRRHETLKKALEALEPGEEALADTVLPFMKYVYLYKARDAVDAKNDRAAEHYYTRVLELDPSLATGYFGRAYARKRLEDMKGASSDLYAGLRRKILASRQFTNIRLVHSKLASSSLDSSALDKAFAVFGEEHEADESRWPKPTRRARETAYRYWAQGRRLLGAGDSRAAIPYFNSAIRENPVDSHAYDDRAAVLFQLGYYREALEGFADSLKYEMLSGDAQYENIIAGHTSRFTWTPNRAAFEAFIEELKKL